MIAPDPERGASADVFQSEVDRLRLLQRITLDFASTLEFDELLPRVFRTVLEALEAEAGSIWIAEGDMLRCRLAVGGAAQRLIGAEMPVGTGFIGDVAQRPRTTIVTHAVQDPRFDPSFDERAEHADTTVMATAMVVQDITVGSIQVSDKRGGEGVFTEGDRELFEGLAASAAIALRNAQLHAADKRARDLAALLEISREITSTLDLDRVLRTVVNAAGRAIPFDRGAVGLYDKGACEIRAIAGQETVNRKDTKIQDLAVRAGWAAGRGETFYLADRMEPASEAERTFVQIFGPDLEADGIVSALYLPLKDDEGVVGVLVFEAERPDLADAAKHELAAILAAQTTVALRNAQLYDRVPLTDALDVLARKKRAFLEIPRQRRLLWAATALLLLAAVTLVRWPLRVAGESPAFRPTGRAEVRSLVPGIVERVFVTEGAAVSRGAPIAQLRDAELRASRAATSAAADAAERAAVQAASRGDAAEERLQRIRADALRQELGVLDEQVAATTIRSPVAGVVLTPRPDERVGAKLEEGDLIALIGRTDTLELEFGVDQRDVGRVTVGDEVRLRVDALPQRTFGGRVTSVAGAAAPGAGPVQFPVRAAVPNPDGLLRPGMAAYARVLTAPASLAERLLREPLRQARLLWWRAWS
ncbi:MAG TPA: GAF domain-containing protein [Gemmatimonadales bacterium]|nr:GAF domain-containing protein [Gemmatimonadales bacterium]